MKALGAFEFKVRRVRCCSPFLVFFRTTSITKRQPRILVSLSLSVRRSHVSLIKMQLGRAANHNIWPARRCAATRRSRCQTAISGPIKIGFLDCGNPWPAARNSTHTHTHTQSRLCGNRLASFLRFVWLCFFLFLLRPLGRFTDGPTFSFDFVVLLLISAARVPARIESEPHHFQWGLIE